MLWRTQLGRPFWTMRFERGQVFLAAPATRPGCAASTYRSLSFRPRVLRAVLAHEEVIVVSKVQPVCRWTGRAIGLDLHRDFCEIAICEEGQTYGAGRVAMTAEGIEALADSLLPTDRVVMEVSSASVGGRAPVGGPLPAGGGRVSRRHRHRAGAREDGQA